MKVSNALLLIILLISAFACKTTQTDQSAPTRPVSNMDSIWQKIDSLSDAGLPASALKEILKIKELVDREQEPAQFVKAIILEQKFRVQTEEDGLLKALVRIHSEIEASDQSVIRAILLSYHSELLLSYAQQQRWSIQNRMPSGGSEDYEEMALSELLQIVKDETIQSFDNEELRTLYLEQYLTILNADVSGDTLAFNTLYDLLAYRALKHLNQINSMEQKPIVDFQLRDENLFAEASKFVEINLTHPDSNHTWYLALQLYQKILSFHLDHKDRSLVIFDLDRLQFLSQHHLSADRSTLYISALEDLYHTFQSSPFSTFIVHDLASAIMQEDQEQGYVRAHTLCAGVIKKYPESPGADPCRGLIKNIEQKSLSVECEEVVIPEESILLKIDYRNVEKVYGRLVRLSLEDRHAWQHLDMQDQISYFLKRPVVHEFSIHLPATEDFRPHAAEWLLPGQVNGYYAILIGTDANMGSQGNAVSVQQFFVSNLAFSQIHRPGMSPEYYAFDRNSGLPVAGVEVQYYKSVYDRTHRRSRMELLGSTVSDDGGRFSVELPGQESFNFKMSKGDDWLWLDASFSNYKYRDHSQGYREVRFYTDRSMYRPGQQLYLKGFLLTYDENRLPSVLTNQTVEVTLYDANGQKVSARSFRSNEYGTFQGSFTLPSGGLMGRMSIGASHFNGRHSVQVEEYKRPTFEVKLDEQSQEFQLGDSLSVAGEVVSYAGVPLIQSQVTYNVVRKISFPYHYFRHFPPPGRSEKVVANGGLLTDDNGRFSFRFKTSVDEYMDSLSKPLYTYEIQVEATELSGETQSTTKHISVGSDPFLLHMNLSGLQTAASLDTLTVKAVNYEQASVEVQGQLTVERLKAPDTWIRSRYWNAVDQSILNADAYPVGPYGSESFDITKLEVEEALAEIGFEGGGEINIATGGVDPGYYRLRLEATSDDGGKVESIQYTRVVDAQDDFIPADKELLTYADKTSWAPGDTAEIVIASPVAHRIMYWIERRDETSNPVWLPLEDWTTLRVPVRELDRGGIVVHLVAAASNRTQSETITLHVPWTNKELSVHTETLRDITEPGAEETVTLTVTDAKGNGVPSEVLASMYDQSLDALTPHHWRTGFWPSFYARTRMQSYGYGVQYGRLFSEDWNVRFHADNSLLYPDLEWFSLQRFMYGMRSARMDMMRMESAAPAPEMAGDQVMSKEVQEEDLSSQQAEPGAPVIRENFDEMVFFYPDLRTNEQGEVSFTYTMNDALTTWKMMALVNTPHLETGQNSWSVVSQKSLMITTNKPRFLRAGDEFQLTARVDNLSGEPQSARVTIEVKDAISGDQVQVVTSDKDQTLHLNPGQSARAGWTVSIPRDMLTPLQITVRGQSDEYTDGERFILPVLSNRSLVTESRALLIDPNADESLVFDRLTEILQDPSVDVQSIQIEVTSNPLLFALKSLPYLLEQPHESTDAVFNRFFASRIGRFIIDSNPSIEQFFRRWQADNDLQSPLRTNEEMKTVTLEETPWVREALSEEAQMQSMAYYFNQNQLDQSERNALQKLFVMQQQDGGFSWFAGGRSNWFTTQYIMRGFGQLISEGFYQPTAGEEEKLTAALAFLDDKIQDTYEALEKRVKNGDARWEENHLSSLVIEYLYVRSLFSADPLPPEVAKVYDFYLKQFIKYWTELSLYEQVVGSMALVQKGDQPSVQAIKKSLDERMIVNEELGIHWNYTRGYRWYQRPISTHVAVMRLYRSLEDFEPMVGMQQWLLNNKRTNRWETGKTTVEAIQALLYDVSGGIQDVSDFAPVEFVLNGEILKSADAIWDLTSRWKFTGDQIGEGAKLSFQNPNDQIAWGAIHWQYMEDLDQVTNDVTDQPLSLEKSIFKRERGPAGDVLLPVESAGLEVGDMVIVQLKVISDREMEFVHIKDLRSSSLEPVNQLSGYQWRDGLGYYQEAKDVATNFFIDHLQRGTYIIQYPLRVSQTGSFSNGYASIQSAYAPEFGDHSEGTRLETSVQN